MSATNKDSDKEAERPSNDDGENPGGSKGDGGKENPGGSKGDGDRKNLDDMDDEDSDDDNSDDAEDDDGGENSDDTYDEDGGENPDDTPGQEIAGKGKFLWKNLDHNGPYFPPEYKPLPDNVHFYYGNDKLKLKPKTEEMATLYAKILAKLERESAERRTTFDKNFFEDWKETMTDEEKSKITDLSKCRFTDMHHYLAKNRPKTKLESKEKEKFKYCTVDEENVQVKSWRIEEPRCYLSTDPKHAEKIGRIRKRVVPKDVTVNCSSTCALAKNQRDKWSEVIHKRNLRYLAKWKCNVTNEGKYMNVNHIFSRPKIFELAFELSNNIKTIRETYEKCLESNDKDEKLMGVVLYIIHIFSLRSGTSTEGATGVCTLKKKHITLSKRDGKFFVSFDFTGKCGNKYYKEGEVKDKVHAILDELQKDKVSEAFLFPDINAIKVNDRLKKIISKITIKVFRTYNASLMMQNELEKATPPFDESTCKKVYKEALEKVAAYLNHQRAASSSGNQSLTHLVESTSNLTLSEKNRQEKKTPPKPKADGVLTDMEWNLQSTKMYYIDHRVVILWCKKNGIPIEHIYSEKDRKSFKWDIDEIEKLQKENKPIEDFLYYKNI